MTTPQHTQHIRTRTSHNNCPECRADTERQFVDRSLWHYQHVRKYLEYLRPRIQAIRTGALQWSPLGESGVYNARSWYRDFQLALHRRITAKAAPPSQLGRKHCDSYLERLAGATKGRNSTTGYLRRCSATWRELLVSLDGPAPTWCGSAYAYAWGKVANVCQSELQ